MILIARDGLPARESGEWASDKLFYVERYMEIFTGSMRAKWPRRLYLDLMSGPGLCKVKKTGQEFDGSPVRSLKTKQPFTDVVLVESNPELATALATRVARDGLSPTPMLIRGDCNDPAVIANIRQIIGRDALVLAFVDLLGMNVTMSTLRALSTNLPMDLIITFPEMDVRRNWRRAAAGVREHAERFDAFFGTIAWRAAVDSVRTTARAAVALLEFYARQLNELDYQMSVLPITMKNSRGGTLYRLIFASRHSLGIKFWTEIGAKREPSGQRRLL